MVPFKERIWVRAHCSFLEFLLPAGHLHPLLSEALSKCLPQFLYTFSSRILGTCFVRTTERKVVCPVKYKGKGPLCGNIVGNVLGCLDRRLQNTKPSSLCQFLTSFLKIPKPTNEISKEAFPPSVSPNVLEAARRSLPAVGLARLSLPAVG